MENKKRSFWDKLTGSVTMEEESEESKKIFVGTHKENGKDKKSGSNWIEEENEEAELAVDVYQTPTDIIVQTFVAGVKPDDLDISIARDIVTIRGEREESRNIDEKNYFTEELYWGKFSRTISLPQEVEPEEVEATEKHGLLTIRLQKVDKGKTNNIKVKSL
ncbi:MAG TPA: Hsp20/alpha crystallin family protein [Candidatus Paceibacterota bacterium]|jgi:HSP20 family protein|nr:Hsp20/alpha crystallin family protein [Candidatus Paceibacterota bacterium]